MGNVQLAEILGLKERTAEGFMGDGDQLLTRQAWVQTTESFLLMCP